MREADKQFGRVGAEGAKGTSVNHVAWSAQAVKSLMLLKQMSTSFLARRTGIPSETLKAWFAGKDPISSRAQTLVQMVVGLEGGELSKARVHVFAVGSRAEDLRSLQVAGATLCHPRLWRLKGEHIPAHPPGMTLYALATTDQHQILISANDRACGGLNINWFPGAAWSCSVQEASALTTNSDLVCLVDKTIPREDVAAELLNDAFLGLSKPHQKGASNLTLRQRLALAEALPY